MDDIAERWARDPETGKTYTVPGSMTYKQWAAKQTGLAKSVKPLEKSTESGIVKSITVDNLKTAVNGGAIKEEVAVKIADVLKRTTRLIFTTGQLLKSWARKLFFKQTCKKWERFLIRYSC